MTIMFNKSTKMESKIMLIFLLCFTICQVITKINAFNIETTNYIRHEGEPNSMFGFSVALHGENTRKSVIVGAPKADYSRYQNGVQNGGIVYRCEIVGDNRCSDIPFDRNGNSYNSRNEKESSKSYQWFGATVVSAGMNGPLMACAPRYVFHGYSPRKVERHEPVGTCFITNNNLTIFDEISPCRTTQWGYHRQGSCQAGFSAAISKTGERLFIGAPGSWYWQGQVYSYNAKNYRDQSFSTKESPSTDDDSYLGYSSVTGDLNGDGEQDVAVGMPRGASLLGKVVIFSQNMTNMRNLTGQQIGEYFGYAIAVADVDGDSLDDLIVGAPMHTEPNNENKYEVGRVYVFYQTRDHSFTKRHFRDGFRSKSRFGLALTTLKDINLDGYEDFAVGAPYDGENERGCVYLYYGSQDGVREKPSQILNPETLSEGQYLKTFGFSLAGGIDLDGNTYPDLAVGAYESNRALVFRSRPVVVIEATTLFSAENKLVSLDNKKCFMPGTQQRVVCTQLDSCIKYHGKNVPTELDINVSWLLDSKKSKTPRLNFMNYIGTNVLNNTIRLFRNKRECRSERVYLVNVKDKLTPLEVEMKYSLPVSRYSSSQRQPTARLEPVLDLNIGTMQTDSINIQKNCGPDNICIPDLRLNVKTVDKFLLGSQNNLKVEVEITNHGEDAFESGFYMNVPSALNFIKTEKLGAGSDTLVTCTAPSTYNNGTLKCDIGNPLPKNREVKFNVILRPKKEATQSPSYDLRMEVNSTNPELDSSNYNNVITKNIGMSIETNLTIFGTSVISGTSETKILYNSTEYVAFENATKEADIGPQTVHIYNIQNTGPSRIEQGELYILWPYATQENKPFVYLLNEPEVHGNIKCERAPHINDLKLDLDLALVKKSYLESAGVYRESIGTASRYHQENQASNRSDSSSSYYSSSSEDYSHVGSLDNAGRQTQYVSSSGSSFNQGASNMDIIPPIARPTTASTGTRFGGWEAESSSRGSGGSTSYQSGSGGSTSYQSGSGGATSYQSGSGGATSYQSGSSGSTSYQSGSVRPTQYSESQGAQGSSSGSVSRDSTIISSGPRYIGGGGKTEYVSGSYGGGQGREVHHSSSTGGSWGSGASNSADNNYNSGARSYERTYSGGSEYSGGRNYSYSSGNRQGATSSSSQWGSSRQGSGSNSDSSDFANTQQFNLNAIQNNDKADDDGLKHYRLFVKRQADDELNNALQCTTAFKCAMLRCVVGPLDNNHDAYIALRTRLVIKTLEEISTDPVSFSTMAVGRVTKLPYIDRPQNEPIKKHEIVNTASTVPVPTEGVIPLWVVILAALAGTLLLLLLILLLYKCGFFKRNRPSRSPETTPLKKAAYGPNDEHL